MALGVTVTDMRTIRETGWPIGLFCFFYSILRGVLSTVSTLASIPAGTDQAKRSKIMHGRRLIVWSLKSTCRICPASKC